jgi:hypothetical protein
MVLIVFLLIIMIGAIWWVVAIDSIDSSNNTKTTIDTTDILSNFNNYNTDFWFSNYTSLDIGLSNNQMNYMIIDSKGLAVYSNRIDKSKLKALGNQNRLTECIFAIGSGSKNGQVLIRTEQRQFAINVMSSEGKMRVVHVEAQMVN